jgi:hypothetical protein
MLIIRVSNGKPRPGNPPPVAFLPLCLVLSISMSSILASFKRTFKRTLFYRVTGISTFGNILFSCHVGSHHCGNRNHSRHYIRILATIVRSHSCLQHLYSTLLLDSYPTASIQCILLPNSSSCHATSLQRFLHYP